MKVKFYIDAILSMDVNAAIKTSGFKATMSIQKYIKSHLIVQMSLLVCFCLMFSCSSSVSIEEPEDLRIPDIDYTQIRNQTPIKEDTGDPLRTVEIEEEENYVAEERQESTNQEAVTEIVLDSGDSINPDFDYDSVIAKFRKTEVPAVRYEIRGEVAGRNVLHIPRVSVVEKELQGKSVKLHFNVRSDGTVYDVRIIESSHQKLTEKAIDFISKFLFNQNRGEQSGEIRILFIKPDISKN